MNADLLSFILTNQPSKLRCNTKVQKQTNIDVRRAQVVQQLLFMCLIDRTSRLKFKQKFPFSR